jgi:hypothetical protein
VNDPPRLIGGSNDFERSLLGAWDTRQPDDAARARTVAALGVGVVALSAGTAAASGSIAPKAMLVSSALMKWVGIGAGVAATVGVVGYASYSRLVAPASPAAAVVVPPLPSATATPLTPEVPRREAPSSPQDDSLSFEPVPAAPARAVAPRPASAPATPSTLDDEVYAIDQARRALTAGNAAAALQLVDAYDAKYPGGALVQESTEIRIEGLFRTGKRPAATKLANRFLAAHPESPYAREIRTLMAAPISP